MSLILEALRKLEKEKDAPKRGFVIMTHVPWARGGSRSRLVGIGALALAVAVGALAVALWRGRAAKVVTTDTKATDTKAAGSAAPTPTPEATPASPPPSPAFEAKALALESLRAAPLPDVSSAVPSSPGAAALAPRASHTPTAKALRLHAISRQDDRPVAIINDRLVREGDVFEGVTVIRIGETEVEVEVRGQRRVLRF